MIFSYCVYGIRICSNTCISGLEPLPTATIADQSLHFETGAQPDWVQRGLELNRRVLVHRPTPDGFADPAFVLTEHGDGECYELSYLGELRFVVNGALDRIWAEVQPPLTNEDLAACFLGPVLGFVLRWRHVTCMHASAVELCGRGVLFSGDAGYGKSTTAGALALRGVPVLAEDIVPFKLIKQHIMVVPGYPRVCLWPDSVESLVGKSDGLPRLTPGWEKRYLPLDGVRGKFSAEEKPLGLIYVFAPRTSDENAPRIEDVSPREALLELVQKTYMNWLLDRQRRAEEFADLSKIVERVPVRRIIAHEDPQRISKLCDVILSDAARALS